MEAVRWWMVFALYKLATIALATAKAFKAGDARRLIRSTDYHFGPLLEAIAHPDEVLAI